MEPLPTTQDTAPSPMPDTSSMPTSMNTTTHTPKHARTGSLLVAVVGIVALCGIGYAVYQHITSPSPLGAMLFKGDSVSGKVIVGGVFGWDEKKVAISGDLSDFARGDQATVAIVRNTDTGAQDVHMLTPTERALTTDGFGKAAVAVSRDGKFVAFSQRADTSIGAEFSARISAWQVVVMDTQTGTIKNYGEGFAPQFFNKDGVTYLLFTTRTGITVINTSTLASRSMVFINPGLVDYAGLVSSDGVYLAVPNGVTKVLDVFSLTLSETDFSVSLLGIAPVAFTHSAFVGNSIEGIVRNADGSLTLRIVEPKQLTAPGTTYALPDASYYRVIN